MQRTKNGGFYGSMNGRMTAVGHREQRGVICQGRVFSETQMASGFRPDCRGSWRPGKEVEDPKTGSVQIIPTSVAGVFRPQIDGKMVEGPGAKVVVVFGEQGPFSHFSTGSLKLDLRIR